MFNKIFLLPAIFFMVITIFAQSEFKKDTIKTSKGNLEITFVDHASL